MFRWNDLKGNRMEVNNGGEINTGRYERTNFSWMRLLSLEMCRWHAVILFTEMSGIHSSMTCRYMWWKLFYLRKKKQQTKLWARWRVSIRNPTSEKWKTKAGTKTWQHGEVNNTQTHEMNMMSMSWMLGVHDNGENKIKKKMKREDVSWSNIHITNELREGLLVEVFIQHPGQTSAQTTEQQEGRREERQR